MNETRTRIQSNIRPRRLSFVYIRGCLLDAHDLSCLRTFHRSSSWLSLVAFILPEQPIIVSETEIQTQGLGNPHTPREITT